jgi:hypothetical protein
MASDGHSLLSKLHITSHLMLCSSLNSPTDNSQIYTAAAVTNFFPSVVATLGFSRNITYALTAPPYILCVIAMLCNGFYSDKTKERYLHIAIPLTVTLLANIIAFQRSIPAPATWQ